MSENLLPISQVAEILYCPRNFYYRMAEGVDDSNEHTLQGKWDDEKREERLSVKRESGMQTRHIHVSSEQLGIVGILDVLETGKETCIVEFKKGEYRLNQNDDVQLCAQAMAYEDMTATIMDFGYVYYHASHRRRKVFFTEDLRELVLQTIERAREILGEHRVPEPINDARCGGCALQARCMPGEVEYLREIDGKNSENSLANKQRLVRPTPSFRLGRVLYIDEEFAYVKKEGRHLKITKNKEVLREVPIDSVDEVVSLSNVQWTTQAQCLLMTEGIPLTFLHTNGRYVGTVIGSFSKNSLQRIRQFEIHQSPERWKIAASFSKGKLQNMRVMMLRNAKNIHEWNERNEQSTQDPNDDLSDIPQYEACMKQIENAIKKLNSTLDRDEILGWEGIGTKAYFTLFRNWIRPPFVFSGRIRRPPTDPVNALLSFGYSLLAKSIESLVYAVGLDPYIGFLHESQYGRPALALDLMEEFRPVIVDSIVLRAINQRILAADDFEQRENSILLKDSARKTFYKLFDQRLSQEITHPVFHYHVTYRRMMELQVRVLAKTLTGEIPNYIPLKVK
ncbi:CRISPR-associated endonuclease Cas1 [Fodinisporobacter ferrooxydans]|uniref:CRISPR-associated endonuclease Cas1 n=1 Tax=Fodinisporobacter ferrooxydans TaxID=2901836 RepID=A0ABY4CS91_9BACL|nr:CRISPR-associated endonuclease Cas1 [Alicyclobacillaceae bacterium MYW30-H2]